MARTAQTETTTPATALYVALELSKDSWKLGFTTSRTQKARIRDVKARVLSRTWILRGHSRGRSPAT